MDNALITVEYILALPDKQYKELLEIKKSSTLKEVLPLFTLESKTHKSIQNPIYGIFNQIVDSDYVLQAGDRIEVYRPLQIDPKTARLIRAERNKLKKANLK